MQFKLSRDFSFLRFWTYELNVPNQLFFLILQIKTIITRLMVLVTEELGAKWSGFQAYVIKHVYNIN